MKEIISTIAIIQARSGSNRLPNKVLKSIVGKPMIELLIKRLKRAKLIDKIVVATTVNEEDNKLCEFLDSIGVSYYRGSEVDVLDRYYQTALLYVPNNIVRITGDCPLIDPFIVDQIIFEKISGNYDNVNNTYPATYPDGLDVEVFSFDTLRNIWNNATEKYDREHVTPYIHKSGLFSIKSVRSLEDFSTLRWTVDELADLKVITNIFEYFAPDIYFSWEDVLKLYKMKPELFSDNSSIERNQGAKLGTGQKLWKRAKTLIPGGNMLLSKRSEMFLPEIWPSYFSKTSGCEVYDLDNNHFYDMSIMGIGTNTLGYSHPAIDESVTEVIRKGNMSTLNCPEEVYLAEKLVELHSWADMVRLTRSGGEANAVAIRIARAAAGKDGVAICGYHGWHDWYLAANLSSEGSLTGHLLPGLEPNGVPKDLQGTIFTFNYNDYETLSSLVKTKNIGVIFMEVMRNHEPLNDFLQKVRTLATEKNIVLVFDECTSGFRETYGGLHLKYNVIPDMAMFGKALGNGYAINAVIGKREIMESAQSTFISSTFWTERIGPVAAVKTLEVMKEVKSWEIITEIGNKVSQQWKKIASDNNINITVSGLSALTSFGFSGENALKYKTFVTQEMLKRGYLASNAFYACTEHKPELVDRYLNELNQVFALIKKYEGELDAHLQGPICHSGFKRLN